MSDDVDLWIAPELRDLFHSLDNLSSVNIRLDDVQPSDAKYCITRQRSLLTLVERDTSLNARKVRYRQHFIDIDKFIAQQKTYPNSKKDLIAKAVGRHTTQILDATGGWGGDALHLTSQGYQVTLLERNPLLAIFLTEAMQRLKESDWAQRHNIVIPEVIAEDSRHYLNRLDPTEYPECIYLDPMFPEKRKASALAKKNMQVLHALVGADSDQERLFECAYQVFKKRIAVKRPLYAQSLGASIGVQPSDKIKGKLLSYDLYLK